MVELNQFDIHEVKEAAKGADDVKIEERTEGGDRKALIAGIALVIVTATIAWIAGLLVDHWRRSRESGIMIDLSQRPFRITKIDNMPFGTLIIVHPDGKTIEYKKVEYDSPKGLEDILKKIMGSIPSGKDDDED